MFLCNRSDYFRALIHFTESKKSSSEEFVSISLNDISPEVFAAVLNFIYSDDCKVIVSLLFPLTIYSFGFSPYSPTYVVFSNIGWCLMFTMLFH